MTFNTGNNVPSTDPRDLYDNAENLDKLVNGADPFYADRKGILRESWAGMENTFATSQTGRETSFTLSQADKESRFQAFLVSSGYVSKGDYAAGVVLAERNEYVAVDATTTGATAGLYRPGPGATLPLTLTGTWATDSANLVLLGDDVLRQELAAPAGASKIGYGGRTLDQRLDENRSILDYDAVADGVADDSAAASAMLAELNRLVIPSGRTVVLKNIELQAGASVEIRGCAKLPSACVDFDRMFYATGKGGITIDVNEIDGNAAGQSGFIGTHLLYMLDCNDLQVNVRHIHDHYAPAGGAFATDDGVRDSSTGCVLIYRSERASVSVGLLDKWGREGIQLRECARSTVSLGHAQGYDGGDEYSGLQVSGEGNSVHRASVDNAGASGVGFDTKNGSLANIISTRSRDNHGINFGHTGYPATGSVATNLLVDGAFRNGISVGASTEDLTIDGFSVRNAGEYGINYSDGAARGKLANGVVDTCGQFNLSAYMTQVEARNVRYAALDALSVRVDAVTGTFATGETVSSSDASAVVRKVLKNRAGDKQILFLNSVSGTFVAGNTISGGTSLASGTIGLVNTPAAKRENTGGLLIEEALLSSGGLGTTTRLSDGTLIHRHTISIPASASVLATVATNYPSAAPFIEAPHTTATVVAVSSTDSFNLERLSVTRTKLDYTVRLKASAAQTYSVDVISIGRWK